MSSPHRTTGYLLAAAGASLFSTKAIIIKLAYAEEMNATLMLAYRMVFALPFFAALGLWALAAKRARGEPMPDAATIMKASAAGFVGYYVASYFDFAGLLYISAQLERLVLFTYPIMIMLLSWALFGERLTHHGLAAAAVTYGGLAVAFASDMPTGGSNTVLGTLFVLAAALAFALHQIFAKGVISTLGSVLYTAISMSTAAVMCILHHAVVSGGDFVASPRFLWLAGACAIVATVLPALCINASLARISSTAVAMISTVSPVVTIGLAILILGEPFNLADAIGSALVIVGVGLYTLGQRMVPQA